MFGPTVQVMKYYSWISIVLLATSAVMLILSLFTSSIWSEISALIAIVVAIVEIVKSNRLDKKIKAYDDALQTGYDANGKITGMTINAGDY